VALASYSATVTGVATAIAETGTLVLDGSPLSGRRALSLLPDVLVCVVEAAQVVGTVPEGLAVVDPVAPLTMISGPSATSDIELQRVEGVHGPRTLIVVLVA
jgi:L-lactate dehydrogenase complex protein LldG